MKAKEFEAKLVALEKSGDRAQAAELIIILRKYAPLYNAILVKQFETRLFAVLTIPAVELPYLHIQSEPLPQINLSPKPNVPTSKYSYLSEITQEIDCESLILSNCDDCTFTGSVSTSATIRDCRNCIFKLKVNQIRMYNCHYCRFVIDSSTNPVVEESSGLVFSPLSDREGNKWNQVRDFSMKTDSFRLEK